MKRCVVGAIFAMIGLLTGLQPSAAAVVLDQSFVPPPSANLGFFINEGFDLVGQVFTAEQNGTLAGVNVDITEFGPGVPLRISIFEVTAGLPTSNLLGSSTLGRRSSSLSDLVTFSTTINIDAGSQYLIAADYPGPPSGAEQAQGVWSGRFSDEYAGGGSFAGNFASGDSGNVTWSADTGDLYFRTYVDASAVPEPSTVVLAALGLISLCLLSGRRRRQN